MDMQDKTSVNQLEAKKAKLNLTKCASKMQPSCLTATAM